MANHISPGLAAGLGKLDTLHAQIIAQAKYRAGGWETVANELATSAVEWFGNEPCKRVNEFRHVCREVFRSEE